MFSEFGGEIPRSNTTPITKRQGAAESIENKLLLTWCAAQWRRSAPSLQAEVGAEFGNLLGVGNKRDNLQWVPTAAYTAIASRKSMRVLTRQM